MRARSNVSTALALCLVLGASPSFALDRDNNPPGWRGGPGTNWENPPGPAGGPGASPNRRSWNSVDRDRRHDRDGDRRW